jgi:hypothetical protein
MPAEIQTFRLFARKHVQIVARSARSVQTVPRID